MPVMPKAVTLALLGLALLGGGTAWADSMKCSNLYATCVADCRKSVKGAALPTCISNCSLRRGGCLRTGCWDEGTRRLCNMERK